MRVFWALVLILVAAAAAVILMRRGETPHVVAPAALPDATVNVASTPPPAVTVPPAAAVQTPPVQAPAPQAASSPSLDSALRDAAKDAGVSVDLPAPSPTPAPAPAPAVDAPKPAPAAATPVPAPAPSVPLHEPDPLEDNPAAALTSLPDVPVGVAVTREDDGSLLVDHRFIIRGDGTAEKPYEISWDYLVSASETYKPRLGQKKLPDWLQLVNNKHVRITGFIAFPLMAQSPDEMLVMLNQWDGCCIGVPPTPYDAVEIKLHQAVRGDDRLKTFGTVEGLFSVDPYLVKDWLIGLYVMKDAKLSNTTGTQTSPHVTKPQP